MAAVKDQAETPGGQVGQRRPGMNNRRLASGKGEYVADVELPGTLHMALLRSPYPHARILSIDVSAALAHPAVVDVVVGREIKEHTKPIPEGWDTEAVGAKRVDWYALAQDRVRFVGEAVAAVVATSRNDAHAALNLIDVEYESLPVVVDAERGLAPDAPLVEPEWGTNVLVTRALGFGDVDAGKEAGPNSVSGRLRLHRTTGAPMEPRGLLASYSEDEDVLTLWDSTQNPHALRVYLAQTLDVRESKLRVIQPHVGGEQYVMALACFD